MIDKITALRETARGWKEISENETEYFTIDSYKNDANLRKYEYGCPCCQYVID